MKKKLNVLVLASALTLLTGVMASCSQNETSSGDVCQVTEETADLAKKAFASIEPLYASWASTGISANQDLKPTASKKDAAGVSHEFDVKYSADAAVAANLSVSEDGLTLKVVSPNSLNGGKDIKTKLHVELFEKGTTCLAYSKDINVIVKATAQMNLSYIYSVNEKGEKVVADKTSVAFDAIIVGIYPSQGLIVGDGEYAMLLFKASMPKDAKVGDAVHVSGTISDFSGLREIGSGATVTKLDAVPAGITTPVALEIDAQKTHTIDFGDDNRLTRIKNAKVAKTTYKDDKTNFYIYVSVAGKEYTVFMNATYSADVIPSWKRVRAEGETAKMVEAGDVVTLTGYVSAYNGVWQLVYGNCEEWAIGNVSVTAASTFVLIGKTTTVTATLKGEAAAFKYTSSDPTIAIVDETTGVVTGVKEGKVSITASIVVGGKTYSDTCYIEVTKITPKTTTISELLGKANPSNTTNFAWDTKNIYQVKGVLEGYEGDAYGNSYLTDPESGKAIKIYGLSGTENSGFSYKEGSWFYSNPKNADKTVKGIVKNGEEVTLNVMFQDAKGVANIGGWVVEHKASEKTYASSIIKAPEHGKASLSLTEPQKYGTKVEVVVTPTEGYVVDSVKVKTAYGETSVSADASGKYFYNVTCKNEVTVSFKEKAAEPKPGEAKTITLNTTTSSLEAGGAYLAETTDFTVNADDSSVFTLAGNQVKQNAPFTKDGVTTPGYLMFNKNKGYIFSKTAINGNITSLEITTGASASDATEYAVTFGSAVLSTRSTADGTVVAKNTTYTFTPSSDVTDAKYFQIAANVKNGQVVTIKVNYTAA